MKIYEYGDKNKPVLLLLPEALCPRTHTFAEFIKYTEKHFHIFAVSYDGMENDGSVFESVEKTAAEIENFIFENLGGKADVVYGSGMGGKIGTLIVSKEKVNIGHLIVSGADLGSKSAFMAKLSVGKKRDEMYNAVHSGEFPPIVKIMLKSYDKREYAESLVKTFEPCKDRLKFISKDTVYNMLYSYAVTKVPHRLVTNTKVHAFHYKFMGDVYFETYKKVFVEPELKVFENEFEEMLFRYPKNFAVMVRACTGMLKK